MSKIIRFATLDDVDNIMKFIDNYWKHNHILARDKKFFLYEHQDNDRINFVISLKDNKINAILGFIKYSQDKSDVATVLWKVIKNENPMLGIELLNFLRESNEYNIVFSPGINEDIIGIFNFLDIYTSYYEHFVLINHQIKNYKILSIIDRQNIPILNFQYNKYTVKDLDLNDIDFDFNKYYSNYIPKKDKNYFIKRYFQHPIYKYKIFGIYKDIQLISLLVTREVCINDSKIIRIVDYLGNEKYLLYIMDYLYKLLLKYQYEYMDFMCYGFDQNILLKAGFVKVNLDSNDLIVPNYFAPFVQKNIKINFMMDSKDIQKIRLCKADGDQDRPS